MILKGSTSSSVQKQSKRQKKLTAKMDDKCPLCLESFDPDDVNFFPCLCEYQICRFCWHRIRTNENGLCPHCRRQYAEDPANFKPLTPEELAKVKFEKIKKERQKKKEIHDSRKQLADVRVVQKNLVFVTGLPMGIDTQEEKYRRLLLIFKECGPVTKCVVNNKTTYAGAQVPRASVYVTYQKIDDALRAYKSLPLKLLDYGDKVMTSLGTTKYCSNFLKNLHCQKQDCMYLHDIADEELSFTKEQIHAGHHLAYGDQLYDKMMAQLQPRLSQSRDPVVSEPEVEVQPKLNNSVQVKDSLNSHPSDSSSSHSPRPNNSSPQQSRLQPLFNRDSQNLIHGSEESETMRLKSTFTFTDYIETVLNKQANGDTSVRQSASNQENTVNRIHRTVNNSEIFLQPESQDAPRKDSWHEQRVATVEHSNNMHNHQNTNNVSNDYGILNGVDSAARIMNGLSLNHHENGISNSFQSRNESSDDDLGFDPVSVAVVALADMVKQPEYQRDQRQCHSMWSNPPMPSSPSNVTPLKVYDYQRRKNPPPGFPVNNMQPNQPIASSAYDSSNNVSITGMSLENNTCNSLSNNVLIARVNPGNNSYNSLSNVSIARMSPENSTFNSPSNNMCIARMDPPINAYNPLSNNLSIPRMTQEDHTYNSPSSNVYIARMNTENSACNVLSNNVSIPRMTLTNNTFMSPSNIYVSRNVPENNSCISPSNNVSISRMTLDNSAFNSPRNILMGKMSPPVQNVSNSFSPNTLRTTVQVPRYQQSAVPLNGNVMMNGYTSPPIRNFIAPQQNSHQVQAVMQEPLVRPLPVNSQNIQSQSISHAQYARVDPNLSSSSFWNVNQSQWLPAENSFQGPNMQDFRPASPANVRRVTPQYRPIQQINPRFNSPSPYPDNPQFMYPNGQHNQLPKEIVPGFP